MLQVVTIILLVLSFSIARAETPEVTEQARRVADLKVQEKLLSAEIRELGGGLSGDAAANAIRTRMYVLEDKINRMTAVSEVLAESRADLDRLRQQVADEPVITLTDLGKEGVEGVAANGVKKLLEAAAKKGAAKAVGPASLVGDAVEYVGKYAIRKINENEIRDLVRQKQVQLRDVLRLIVTLRQAQNEDRARLARLEDLRRQANNNFAALAKEQAKLDELRKPATADANVKRVDDAEGDEQLRKEALNDAVRLCDPSTRKPQQGVRPAAENTTGASSGEAIPEQSGGCLLADGPWLLHWDRPPMSDAVFEVSYTGPPDPGPGAATYSMVGGVGQNMRCTAAGLALTCEVQPPPAAQCSGLAWPWMKGWNMEVASDGPKITGSWKPPLSLNVTTCAFAPAPPTVPEFTFSMKPAAEADAGEVSAK